MANDSAVSNITTEKISSEKLRKLEKEIAQKQLMMRKMRRDKTVPREAVRMSQDRINKLLESQVRQRKLLKSGEGN